MGEGNEATSEKQSLGDVVAALAANLTATLVIVVDQGKTIQQAGEAIERLTGRVDGLQTRLSALSDDADRKAGLVDAALKVVDEIFEDVRERIGVVESRGEQAAERLSFRIGEADGNRREIRNDVQDLGRRIGDVERSQG